MMARNPWRRSQPRIGRLFFHSRLRQEIPESPVSEWPRMLCRVEATSSTHVAYSTVTGQTGTVALNDWDSAFDSWAGRHVTAAFPFDGSDDDDGDTDDDGSQDDGDNDGAPFENGGGSTGGPPGAAGGGEGQDTGPSAPAPPEAPPMGDQAVQEEQSDKLVFRCPFCGSQGIVGRSDGSIDCSACETRFMVEVMPQFPHAPLVNDDGTPFEAETAEGYPDESPGVARTPNQAPDDAEPMGEPTRRPAFLDDDHPSSWGGPDTDADADADGIDDDSDGNPFGDDPFGGDDDTDGSDADTDDDGVDDEADIDDDNDGLDDDEETNDDGDTTPGFLKDPDTSKKKSKDKAKESRRLYRTASGAQVDEDAYLRHLAWQHGERPRVR